MMSSLAPESTALESSGAARYVLAVVLTALAASIRQLLDPLLAEASPYITFTLSIGAVSLFAGWRLGVFATVLGTVIGFFLFLYWPGRFNPSVPRDYVQAGLALIVGTGLAFLADWGRRQAQRAKLALAQRAENETLLRAIADQTPDLVFVKDRELRTLFANPATLALVGKPANAVIGKTAEEVFSDRRFVEGIHENERRVIETGSTYVVEEEAPTAAGPRVFQIVKMPYRDADGRILGLIGMARDVTDRKRTERALRESEERLRAFMHDLPGAAWIKDREGRYVYANPEAERIFGATLAQLAGATDEEIFPRDTARQFRENDRRVLTEGGSLRTIEVMRQPDGIDHHSIVSKFLLPGLKDATPTVGGVAFDITELKRAEEALKEADRRKDMFMATLAHELRNPISTLSAGLNLLEREGTRERMSGIRRALRQQADNLTRLVDDLLDLGRITQGKVKIEKETIDVRQSIEQAAEATSTLIEERKHTLRMHLPANPVFVRADPLRIQQIFANLLTNAAKYTKEGGRLSVSLRHDDDFAIADVKDTGIGIPKEQQERIFEPFTQVHSGVKGAKGGLGIGLALVKSLTELHGGAVEVESGGADQGSVFTVRLPLEHETRAEEAPQIVHVEPLEILLVEDNRDAAFVVGAMLQDAGHVVSIAYDGSSGLSMAAEMLPDVVLLDINLPDIDGYEVCRKFRERGLRQTLVIAVTAYGQEHDRQASKRAGFDFHILKPLHYEALCPLLAEWQHSERGRGVRASRQARADQRLGAEGHLY